MLLLVADTLVQGLHLLKVILRLLLGYSQSCCGGFRVFQLTLLELEIATHFADLLLRWQLVLALHSLLHVLKQARDELLALLDFLLILDLFFFELLREFVDLFLLLVEDLVLLLITAAITLFSQVVVNLLDIGGIVVDHALRIEHLFLHLLQLSVVLLDSILETLTGLTEGKVHFISLKFKVILLLEQLLALFLQVLSSLLEGILSETRLSLDKTLRDFIELVSRVGNFLVEQSVFFLQFLVLIALFRVKIVESRLVGIIYLLDFRLSVLDLTLHVTLFAEEVVQVSTLLIILVLDVHVERLNVLRLRVTAVLVKSKIVVSEFSFKLANVLNERLIFTLKSQVGRIVLVDVLDFLLHLVDFTDDLAVLVLQQVHVVRAVIDLTTGALVVHLDARHTMHGDWTINCSDFRVVANTREIGIALSSSGLTHRRADSHASLHSICLFHCKYGELCRYLKFEILIII